MPNNFLKNYIYLFCGRVGIPVHSASVEVKGQLLELVLSLYCVGSQVPFQVFISH